MSVHVEIKVRTQLGIEDVIATHFIEIGHQSFVFLIPVLITVPKIQIEVFVQSVSVTCAKLIAIRSIIGQGLLIQLLLAWVITEYASLGVDKGFRIVLRM